MTLKELRYGDARGFFDFFIEVDEAPAKLLREARADGAFAGAHEAGQRDDGNTRGVAAKNRRLIHDSCRRGLIALQNSNCTTV